MKPLRRLLSAVTTPLSLACLGVALLAPSHSVQADSSPHDAQTLTGVTSSLDRRVNLPGFGNIAYRAPLPRTRGPIFVLVHGVFAGATHRSFNELLPPLDAAGARVYTLDLPGTGQSDSPKRAYSMALLDQFVETFLDQVVDAPATLVAESLLGGTALKVAALRPDLVARVALLSPTGVVNLESPPGADATSLYNAVYSNDGVGLLFYQTLLSDLSLRFFLGRTYLDKSKLTEALLDEYRLARRQLGQRWISFSFVGGQLHRKFADVAPAVRVPVLALFGKQAESPGPTGRADNATDFAAIRSDFEYQVIDGAGLNVHREKPDVVAERLLAFAK
jgi:pimeloyl-ACP methyl ester carboxylesterase